MNLCPECKMSLLTKQDVDIEDSKDFFCANCKIAYYESQTIIFV